MPRLVVHAGFHKTGTTSVQTFLRRNAKALATHVRCAQKVDFPEITNAARAFSISPSEASLAAIETAAAAFFATLDANDPRPVLMASEDLCGHMPGRHGLTAYDGAALAMKALADAARGRFGPETDLVFYFSTRSPENWRRSTWWQNLRSTRLTLDLDDYLRQFEDAPTLEDTLKEIAQDVAPARVEHRSLDDVANLPFGPATPLLDLLGLDEGARAALTQVPPANTYPDIGLDAVFLALNRSGLPDRDLREIKKVIHRTARETVAS